MCIGQPMRVIDVSPGHALCRGRGETQRVVTALIGEPRVGDWLMVFLGSARECIDAQRAAEVNAALDLLEAAMHTTVNTFDADPGFVLPSSLDVAALAALTGASPTADYTAPMPVTEP